MGSAAGCVNCTSRPRRQEDVGKDMRPLTSGSRDGRQFQHLAADQARDCGPEPQDLLRRPTTVLHLARLCGALAHRGEATLDRVALRRRQLGDQVTKQPRPVSLPEGDGVAGAGHDLALSRHGRN